jgi:RHS repeat-associated protein
MDEGVVNDSAGYFKYEYFIKDHLGNTRISFENHSGAPLLTQSVDYYPFGMQFVPTSMGGANKYLYNGKEYQDGLGLDWYDYGARFYDPQIGRWTTPDPLTENSVGGNPYIYALNSPMRYIDPNGLDATLYGAEAQEEFKKEQDRYNARHNNEKKDKKEKGHELNSLIAHPVSEVIGIELIQVPNQANLAGANYSTILVTSDGKYITVGGVREFERLLSLRGYSKPLMKKVLDLIVRYGKPLEILGKTTEEVSPYGIATYDIVKDCLEYKNKDQKLPIDMFDLGIGVGSTTLGAIVGGTVGGPAGAIVGGVIDLNLKNAYKAFKSFYNDTSNWWNNVTNPANWYKK